MCLIFPKHVVIPLTPTPSEKWAPTEPVLGLRRSIGIAKMARTKVTQFNALCETFLLHACILNPPPIFKGAYVCVMHETPDPVFQKGWYSVPAPRIRRGNIAGSCMQHQVSFVSPHVYKLIFRV